MSNTRHSADGASLHQSAWASNPAMDHGITAYQVAKRTACLERVEDRELIWTLQKFSVERGLASVKSDLLNNFLHRFGTPAMVQTGKQPGEHYTAAEVAQIRAELPRELRAKFPLKGELDQQSQNDLRVEKSSLRDDINEAKNSSLEDGIDFDARKFQGRQARLDEKISAANAAALQQPDSYPVSDFLAECVYVAENSTSREIGSCSVENALAAMCLERTTDLTKCAPWYFSELVNALRDYQRQWVAEKSKAVMTAVGEKVFEVLDDTRDMGGLSLLIGNSGLGAPFAFRSWCDRHPGTARVATVPIGNDDASFLRDLAKEIGIGNFLNYKNVQIRERLESVLQSGEIMLVLLHAERLWPQKNLREAFPGRFAWILDQMEKGAKICLFANPQFFMTHRACEKTGWNSPELRNKINNFSSLPDSLGIEDLTSVARVMLPAAGENLLEKIALYAFAESGYLNAIEKVIKRATISAGRAGRNQLSSQDITSALAFVSGSDAMLRNAIAPAAGNNTRRTSSPLPVVAPSDRAKNSIQIGSVQRNPIQEFVED